MGTYTVNVGIVGNKAYVVSTDTVDFGLGQSYYWADVYDVTDPAHPVWIDAFEPAARGHFVSCDAFLYEITPGDLSAGPPFPGIIAVYDTSSGHPVLLSKEISPVAGTNDVSQNGCLFTEISYSSFGFQQGKPVLVDVLNLQGGVAIHTQYNLPVQDSVTGFYVNGAASDGKRMFLQIGEYLIAYDITTPTPTEIGLLQTGYELSSGVTMVGNLLFEYNTDFEAPSSQIFDITNPQPVALPSLPIGAVLSSSGNIVFAGIYESGFDLVDLSNPLQPAFVGTAFDWVDARYTAVLDGNYAFVTEGFGGWTVFDAGEAGGLLPTYLPNPFFSGLGAVPLDEVVTPSYLYVAAGSSNGGGVFDLNLATTPPTLGGYLQTSTPPPDAVALSIGYPELGRAQNWQQFLDILRTVPGPGQNAVYADVDGNIGYALAAWIPVRRSGRGEVPVPGDTDAYEWTGYIPFDQFPKVLNPPEGMIATANARIVGPAYPYYLTDRWAGPYRTARMYQLLQNRAGLTPADANAVQNDIVRLPDVFLAARLLKAANSHPPGDGRLRELLARLQGWDGRARANSLETSFVDYTRHMLLRDLLAPYLGDKVTEYDLWEPTSRYEDAWWRAPVFLENVLRQEPAEWLPTDCASYDELLMRAAQQAVSLLEKETHSVGRRIGIGGKSIRLSCCILWGARGCCERSSASTPCPWTERSMPCARWATGTARPCASSRTSRTKTTR